MVKYKGMTNEKVKEMVRVHDRITKWIRINDRLTEEVDE